MTNSGQALVEFSSEAEAKKFSEQKSVDLKVPDSDIAVTVTLQWSLQSSIPINCLQHDVGKKEEETKQDKPIGEKTATTAEPAENKAVAEKPKDTVSPPKPQRSRFEPAAANAGGDKPRCFVCEVCSVRLPLTSSVTKDHTKSRNHNYMMQIRELGFWPGLTEAEKLTGPPAHKVFRFLDSASGDILCTLCNLKMPNATELLKHQMGNDHGNKIPLRLGTPNKVMWCATLCLPDVMPPINVPPSSVIELWTGDPQTTYEDLADVSVRFGPVKHIRIGVSSGHGLVQFERVADAGRFMTASAVYVRGNQIRRVVSNHPRIFASATSTKLTKEALEKIYNGGHEAPERIQVVDAKQWFAVLSQAFMTGGVMPPIAHSVRASMDQIKQSVETDRTTNAAVTVNKEGKVSGLENAPKEPEKPVQPAKSGAQTGSVAGKYAAPATPSSTQQPILHVSNIHGRVTELDLRREFSKFAKVVGCRIIVDPARSLTNDALIQFDSLDSANRVMERQFRFENKVLRFRYAKQEKLFPAAEQDGRVVTLWNLAKVFPPVTVEEVLKTCAPFGTIVNYSWNDTMGTSIKVLVEFSNAAEALKLAGLGTVYFEPRDGKIRFSYCSMALQKKLSGPIIRPDLIEIANKKESIKAKEMEPKTAKKKADELKETVGTVRVVHMWNLEKVQPPILEQELLETCAIFGPIRNYEMVHSQGKLDRAYIEFWTENAACKLADGGKICFQNLTGRERYSFCGISEKKFDRPVPDQVLLDGINNSRKIKAEQMESDLTMKNVKADFPVVGILLNNLSNATKVTELLNVCAKFGKPVRYRLPTKAVTGLNRFMLVEFDSVTAATNFINAREVTLVDGSVLVKDANFKIEKLDRADDKTVHETVLKKAAEE